MRLALSTMVWLLLCFSAREAAPPASQPAPASWISQAREKIRSVRDDVAKLQSTRQRLAQLGRPPESEPALKFLAWYDATTDEGRKLTGTLGPLERQVTHGLIDLWTLTCISKPIVSHPPDQLIEHASEALGEYENLLKRYEDTPFEAVYFREANDNLGALDGPYYRQAANVMLSHVAIDGASPLWLVKLDRMDNADEGERRGIKQLMSEWYYGHLAYGYKWEIRSGKLLLRPETRESFLLEHPRL